MNATFTMVKRNVILCDNRLEIYHAGMIETQRQYDLVNIAVRSYLLNEGFLDEHPEINEVHIFDYIGKQVFREKLPENDRPVS